MSSEPVARLPGNASSATSPDRSALSMPPMGMPPHDGPTSPSRGDGAPRMNPDQEQPPAGYYPGYGGPPYHPPYPPPPHQGAYPGSYAQPGYPPYGYTPHIPSYPGYGPPPYGYGYGGGYPSQQVQSRPEDKEKARRKSPARRSSSKTSPPRSSSSPEKMNPPKVHVRAPEDIEEERQRASLNITPTKVKPMRSAFHFFMDDMQEKLRDVALEEVQRTSRNEQVDMFLLNSNLNGRIMKAWEDSETEVRDLYMKKEENDRRRFMADDEVASRHCATLTARSRSPRLGSPGQKGSSVKSEDDDDDEDDDEQRNGALQGDDGDNSSHVGSEPENKEGSTDKAELDESAGAKKRTSPSANGDESPTKKIRAEEEEEVETE